MTENYKNYVNHPRYGRGPRKTGLNPKSSFDKYIGLTSKEILNLEDFDEDSENWIYLHLSKNCRIPNTAIVADESKQLNATFPVTHYFDVKRTCLECKKPFIFFAEEQKYWYEELGFNLSANSVRCFYCRKQKRKIENNLLKLKERYQKLFHIKNRTRYETLEMAEYCLSLIELKEFSLRKIQLVRRLLNQLSTEKDERVKSKINEVRQRVLKLEKLIQ